MKRMLLAIVPHFTTDYWACYRVSPPSPLGSGLTVLKPIMPARLVTEDFHGMPDQVLKVRCFAWLGWEWRHRPVGVPISWKEYLHNT